MSDPTHTPDTPQGARPGKLPSARDRAGGEGRRGQAGGRGSRGQGPRRPRGRPPPARPDDASAPPAPAPEPDEAEVGLAVGGELWSVRVLGRSASGRGVASSPLILLGFWSPGSPGDGPPARETLVVGRTLAGLSEAELLAAHARSGPPPAAAGGR